MSSATPGTESETPPPPGPFQLSTAERQRLQASSNMTADLLEVRTPAHRPVPCKVVDVYDSDSCTINLMLPSGCAHVGCRRMVQLKLRLRRIDGPEIRSRRRVEKLAAETARNWLVAFVLGKPLPITPPTRLRRPDVRAMLALAAQPTVAVICRGTDKYGRVLAELYRDGLNASDWLLAQGLVQKYGGGGRKLRFTDAHLIEMVAKDRSAAFAPRLLAMTAEPYACDEAAPSAD
jgi:endonuclease YncB( thermonuclease family)